MHSDLTDLTVVSQEGILFAMIMLSLSELNNPSLTVSLVWIYKNVMNSAKKQQKRITLKFRAMSEHGLCLCVCSRGYVDKLADKVSQLSIESGFYEFVNWNTAQTMFAPRDVSYLFCTSDSA